MQFRKTVLAGIFATSLAFGGSAALAEDATPGATTSKEETPTTTLSVGPKSIKSTDGTFVGSVTMWEEEDGVHVVLQGSPNAVLTPGEHGVHIHETGMCDPDGEKPFDSAGGHFNPTDEHHGDVHAAHSHGGDLGNLTVEEDGSFEHRVVVSKVTLEPGAMNSLSDADGSAIVIHAGEDDLMSDPAGDSGKREACGVIFAPTDEMSSPVASPTGTPEASPAS